MLAGEAIAKQRQFCRTSSARARKRTRMHDPAGIISTKSKNEPTACAGMFANVRECSAPFGAIESGETNPPPSALDPRAPAAGDVGQLLQRDLRRVAHRAHEQRAMRHA